MDNFNGVEVRHTVFGKGIIENMDGNKLTVKFDNGIQKRFLFPDSIKTFLITDDTDLIDA